MITLYRKTNCELSDRIEDKLKAMVLAHQVKIVDSDNEDQAERYDTESVPVLVDEGRQFAGEEVIMEHLRELENYKSDWDKFQSDSCYCDDDGDVE
ncbi:MAG: hypothetical protein GF313_01505 [Caldithrix sp.]|nr:hypothetical protein [Caldithrix sp.]